MFYQYNRQGQRTKLTDQNGSIHEYSYDKLGRLTLDAVTTLGEGVDDRVLAIGMTYEARGLVEKITSFGGTGSGWLEFELADWLPWERTDWLDFPLSGSTSGVVNEVRNAYNSFQQLITQYQEHAGAVNTMTSPKVEYAYADGSLNTIRLQQITYPDGREIDYSYGASDGDDDLLGRIQEIQEA